MYSHLFSFPTGQLLPTTPDHVYRNIYNKLYAAKKPQAPKLVKLSETTQFRELKVQNAIKTEFDCLKQIEVKLQEVIKGVQKDWKKSGFCNLSANQKRLDVDRACWRLRVELEEVHSAFENGLQEEGATRNFYQEVEGLGKNLQHLIDNSLDGIKMTVEQARKSFQTDMDSKTPLNFKTAIASVDSRIQRACGNFDATKKLTEDLFLKGIQSAKEEFETEVNRQVEEFEGATTKAMQRLFGEIGNFISVEPSTQLQNQEHKTLGDKKIQVQSLTDYDKATLEAIARSITSVVQTLDSLKGKIPKILTKLAGDNNYWMCRLKMRNQEDSSEAFFCLIGFMLGLLFCCVVLLQYLIVK